jgi:Tol biopolymer transport system component
MPWNTTTLYLSDIGTDGAPAGIRVIAGGVAESVFQPEWSPDGDEVIFVSDRTGWWNLYACDVATGTTRPLSPMQAEFGAPQWNLSPAPSGSYAPTRRRGSGNSPYWI